MIMTQSISFEGGRFRTETQCKQTSNEKRCAFSVTSDIHLDFKLPPLNRKQLAEICKHSIDFWQSKQKLSLAFHGICTPFSVHMGTLSSAKFFWRPVTRTRLTSSNRFNKKIYFTLYIYSKSRTTWSIWCRRKSSYVIRACQLDLFVILLFYVLYGVVTISGTLALRHDGSLLSHTCSVKGFSFGVSSERPKIYPPLTQSMYTVYSNPKPHWNPLDNLTIFVIQCILDIEQGFKIKCTCTPLTNLLN